MAVFQHKMAEIHLKLFNLDFFNRDIKMAVEWALGMVLNYLKLIYTVVMDICTMSKMIIWQFEGCFQCKTAQIDLFVSILVSGRPPNAPKLFKILSNISK